jgi:hypothetical protein
MRAAARLYVSSSLAVGLVALACFTGTGAPHEAGLDFWRLPQAQREAEDGLRQSDALDARLRVVLDCHAAKERALAALLAGRLPLREAAARFRRADLANPSFPWSIFPDLFPGANDAERHAREVIEHARVALRDEPARAAAVVSRLEAELQEDLTRGAGPPETPPRTE